MRRTILTASAVAAVVIGSPGLASAAGSTYVTPDDVAATCATPGSTTFCAFQRDGGKVRIGTGAADAASGSDHLLIDTPESNDKANVFTYDFATQDLDAITTLGYRSWVDPASTAAAHLAPALNVEIDSNGSAAGGYAVLVWEPVYVDGESTARGTWLDRSPSSTAGGWWSNANLPVQNQAAGTLGFVQYQASWSDVQAALPDATVLGIGPNQGGGNPGLSGQVDLLRVNDTVYDFELEEPPPATPTSKDDCKGTGWASFSEPTFRNQGQCVSFVVRSGAAQQR